MDNLEQNDKNIISPDVSDTQQIKKDSLIRVSKKEMKRGTITTIKYVSLAVALFASARFVHHQTIGEVELRKELEREIDELGLNVTECSTGLKFDINGQSIDITKAIEIIKNATGTCDMSDAEAYIAVKSLYSDVTADAVVDQMPSNIEIIKAKEEAFENRNKEGKINGK